MPRSPAAAAMGIALTALISPAYAGGAEEIVRLCSQPDSQMSGGQVAFCHAFWQGAADALKHPATPVSAAVSATPPPAPVQPPVVQPPVVQPSASLQPGEIPLDQGPAREIPLDQGPAR